MVMHPLLHVSEEDAGWRLVCDLRVTDTDQASHSNASVEDDRASVEEHPMADDGAMAEDDAKSGEHLDELEVELVQQKPVSSPPVATAVAAAEKEEDGDTGDEDDGGEIADEENEDDDATIIPAICDTGAAAGAECDE
mmetsp:Transcript_5885/g.15039  ORF Transcript_5885/g.15039 Transcript_5885/m.15039 type:complete len:138 (-) Transcript_5885:37-450(-)